MPKLQRDIKHKYINVVQEYLEQKYDLADPKIVSALDELSLWSAQFGIKLLESVKLKKNIKALDIGFGLGFPMIELAMRLGSTSEVYGIDPWEAAIERAKFKINVYQVKNIKITNGVAENLPYDDNFFDLIVSNNGINNVEDIKKTLSECYRVCKTDAQFVFTMNLKDTMIEFYNVYEDVLKEKEMHEEIKKMKEQIYSKRKPLTEMENLVKESGFKVNQIKHDLFSFRYTDGTAMLNHFLIKIGFMEGWIEILPEDKVKSVFKELENKLNKISEEFTELKLSIPFVTFDCKK